jgi:hypothetical protein
VRLAVAPLMVDGDRTRLVQVAANLVNNAAKYTPEGGRIEVTLDAVDGRAQLMVRDNGNGIGPDLLPVVFDLFTQGFAHPRPRPGRPRPRPGPGPQTGRTARGRVDAASPGPGRGSTFTVTPAPPLNSGSEHIFR